jgi:hypothetical protein
MVCLRNISVDTLHKEDTDDDNDNNNNNNNVTGVKMQRFRLFKETVVLQS